MLLSSSDLSEYGALPAAVRAEVDAWVREFEGASRPLTKAFADIAGRMSCDATTVRRKFYAWTKSGQDFRSLINRAKIPERRNLPAEFIEFWRSLCERNQRKCKPAHRALVAAWRSGAAIPGYEGTDQPRHEIPAGWDYSNLMRYRPTKFELATMRQGTAFAKAHAPQVFSTRVGLWPGSHYMFDDVWHDNKVMFRGKPVRAVEIGALDVFSGMRVSWGTKPRFEREDGTMDSVNEALMRFMLAGLLWQHGYDPERGTVLMAEHGSAAIRETIEKTLFDRSGGKIRVSRSGITGAHQSVAGMFKGKGGGNFRFKAALESSHNLIHNELAMLPGQTGMDVARRPEELSGMLKYSDDLMKAAALLPPQRRALLQFPLHDYFSHFLPLLGDVYDVINRRGEDPDRFDHDLEGWEALGHTVVEYRLSAAAQQWIGPGEFLKLPEPERQALARFAQAAPEMYARTRKLSPREVWTANRQRLRPVPAFVISEILGEDLGREVRTGNGYFEFSDADISAEPLLFEARVTDEQGRQCELRDREKYLVFCNPFAADQLFVHDARLGHIGVAQRVKRVSRLDPKALAEAAKRAAERTNDLLVDVRKRHTAMTRERTEMLNHNADVIEGRTMTPAERAALDESDRLKKAYDTLIETYSYCTPIVTHHSPLITPQMHDTTHTPTQPQPAPANGKPFPFDADLHTEAQAYMARRDEDYGKRGKRYRLSDFATELGISTSYASRYLDGKPNFPVDKLERALRSILRHEARRRMLVHSLFPTQQSRRLESFAEELKATNSVGLVYGESGSGKSAAVNLYTQANPSTIYIELNRWERTGSEIERMLCEFLDPGDRQRGPRARALWLVEHLTDSGRLIVVDDADEATYDALKWLFDFSDKTKVPVMLVGNEDVLRIIRRNPKMFSRLGLFESLEMPDGSTLRKQVRTLLDALCPDQAEAIVDLAVAVAERPHGGHLRAVQKRVVMMQTIMAKAAAAGTEAARELAQPETAFRSADKRLPEPGIERPELRRK